jgi:diadenosine tetraphosphatase ApaH/serine/threonine PP2A family protein phosphatase
VLTALFTDIHGNREALEACLAHARRRTIDQFVFLGDYVGYGADPAFSVDAVMAEVERGAVALRGNHDQAVISPDPRLNWHAAAAINWTREQLSSAQLDFLRDRPMTHSAGDRLFVHASAHEPETWQYILDFPAATRSLRATDARVTFCGHVHVPALFTENAQGNVAHAVPQADVALMLATERRWLAVIGAVGQPRDHNPAACYALHDDVANTLTYVRVPYDIAAAQRKILAAGMPEFLAARLAVGR